MNSINIIVFGNYLPGEVENNQRQVFIVCVFDRLGGVKG